MKHLFLLTIAVILFTSGVVCIDIGLIFPESIFLYSGFLVMSITVAYLFIARMVVPKENNHEEEEQFCKNFISFLFMGAIIIISVACALEIMLQLHFL